MIEELEIDIEWFNHKIESVMNRTETEYRGGLRRLILQRNKLLRLYDNILNKKNSIGIKLYIKPHKF